MSRTQSAARIGGDDWRLAEVGAVVGLEGEEALAMQIILRAARHSLTRGVGGNQTFKCVAVGDRDDATC